MLCSPSTLCRQIGLLFGERLDTLFTSSDSKISGFTRPHVIGFVADIFFSTLESGFFFSGFAVEFAGYVWTVAVYIRKEKVADSEKSGYVWMGPQFVRQNLDGRWKILRRKLEKICFNFERLQVQRRTESLAHLIARSTFLLF